MLSAFNQLDRQLTSVLLEPIRREFALSDVQLGLLSGLAFAVLYAGLSLPAAVVAVYGNRRNLIAASAALWGGMTLLCGIAQSYGALLVGRVGVGLGEAGAMPASHAVISDLYGPQERGGALAAWSAGVNIGVFLAFLIGGTIGQVFGWRWAFVACGLATMILALLSMAVAEPARARDDERARWRSLASRWLFRETVQQMTSDAPLRHILWGSLLMAIIGYGELAWAPSLFVRVHGLPLALVGIYLAVVAGVIGGVGAMLGGRFTDRLERRRAGWGFIAVAAVCVLARPFGLVCYLTTDTKIALAALIPAALVATLFVGPSLAALHNRMPATLRPMASAIYLMVVNLVGLGLGPLLIGAMSQWVFAAGGPRSLGFAMAAVQLVGLWGSAHFFWAGRQMGRRALLTAGPALRDAA